MRLPAIVIVSCFAVAPALAGFVVSAQQPTGHSSDGEVAAQDERQQDLSNEALIARISEISKEINSIDLSIQKIESETRRIDTRIKELEARSNLYNGISPFKVLRADLQAKHQAQILGLEDNRIALQESLAMHKETRSSLEKEREAAIAEVNEELKSGKDTRLITVERIERVKRIEDVWQPSRNFGVKF